MKAISRIAYLRPGAMGVPMVHRLLRSGREVHVWTNDPVKAEDIVAAGGLVNTSMQEVVDGADLVISCLRDEDATRSVYIAENGEFNPLFSGKHIVEHGTFSPEVSRELHESAQKQQALFFDAPVSGGPSGAAEGKLVCMVGGSEKEFLPLFPVLSEYCGLVSFAGASGAGQTLKLINQMLVAVHTSAAAEASAMVVRAGIDSSVAFQILSGGWANSRMLELWFLDAHKNHFDGGGATLSGLVPVLEHARDLAESLKVEATTFESARIAIERFSREIPAHYGFSALAIYFAPELRPSDFMGS